MNKLKPTDVKGYVGRKHQPYTDYSQEIADWLVANSDATDFGHYHIFTGRDTFYTHDYAYNYEVYYTNEEYKKLIGMTNSVDVKEKLDKLLETDRDAVLAYMKELNTREENLRKELELEFAEAKKQRLENHINVLKSKLK